MAVSSANKIVLEYFTDSGKSLMKTRKSKGPRTDPCGTPIVRFLFDERVLQTEVCCDL